MARRKDRVAVVFDTNVIVGALLSTKRQSVNQRVYRLWLHRQLQLIVSPEIAAEYLELIERLCISPSQSEAFRQRLQRHDIITHVKLGSRSTESHDPDDNLILATAAVGKAEYLITQDHDLLDIPPVVQRRFKFKIVTPVEFLKQREAM